jgi:hypothetical protein
MVAVQLGPVAARLAASLIRLWDGDFNLPDADAKAVQLASCQPKP